MLRAVVMAAAYFLFLAAVLLAPARRLDWSMAWAFLSVYLAVIVVAFFVVDPDLIRERSRMGPGVKRCDVALASVSFVCFFPLTLLVAGLDAGRFEWSPPFPVAAQPLALAVFALATAFSLWAEATNRFFSTFVRIQTDRGHRVVTDGPYAYVRHPGYAGQVMASLALALALGSLLALVPAFVGSCLLAVRTLFEDRTLMDELDGYREYASRVRSRLLPGVW
jgi:protein-S-isoprenylcysteine O-methyltransferase Ste14